MLSLPRFWDDKRREKVSDGGQLEARMKNDERKDISKILLSCMDLLPNAYSSHFECLADDVKIHGHLHALIREQISLERNTL